MTTQPPPAGIRDLGNRFTYHPPRADQIPLYEQMRARTRELAEWVNEVVPDGREKSLAVTHLEEAVMWANAGIARQS